MRYRVVSVAEMVAIEQAADRAGYSYEMMMARAGLSLAEAILEADPIEGSHPAVLGLVGTGNNGGDALVAMSHLLEIGWQCQAYLTSERSGDPLVTEFIAAGGEVIQLADDPQFLTLQRLALSADILIDGLLGTGIKLPLRSPVQGVLLAVGDCLESSGMDPFVVAVDCPSGVDCDSGEAAEACLPADLTVCMAALKQGLIKLPAYGLLGELVIGEIGLWPDLPELAAIQRYMIDGESVRELLPERPLDGHKGKFGKALIVGGSGQYPGAPVLAGKAAFRSGAGWVEMAVPGGLKNHLAGSFLEATWAVVPGKDEAFDPASARMLFDAGNRADAVLVGPGIGMSTDVGAFIKEILSRIKGKLVIDADGLKHLAGIENWWQMLPRRSILTPHPGEMSVLTGQSVAEIQQDRMAAAEKWAAVWGQVVVLKGAFTVVVDADGRSAALPLATPALARAGSGDVLAGLICGLAAQGMDAYGAALCGVWLHGQAGLAAAEFVGSEAGVLAGDLIDQIPRLLGE
jgi:NAD(P)H-hydrate epimerase